MALSSPAEMRAGTLCRLLGGNVGADANVNDDRKWMWPGQSPADRPDPHIPKRGQRFASEGFDSSEQGDSVSFVSAAADPADPQVS